MLLASNCWPLPSRRPVVRLEGCVLSHKSETPGAYGESRGKRGDPDLGDRMIGRSAELAALAAAVAAEDRRPVVLLGEEGIGKTTLLRAAAQLAARQGFA